MPSVLRVREIRVRQVATLRLVLLSLPLHWQVFPQHDQHCAGREGMQETHQVQHGRWGSTGQSQSHRDSLPGRKGWVNPELDSQSSWVARLARYWHVQRSKG